MTGASADITSALRSAIKARRAELGITAKDLAERLVAIDSDLEYSVLANFESERRKTLTVAELAELAIALDTTPAELLDPGVDSQGTVTLGGAPVPLYVLRLFFAGSMYFDRNKEEWTPTIRGWSAASDDVARELLRIEQPLATINLLIAELKANADQAEALWAAELQAQEDNT